MKHQNQDGFSLVELVVAFSIFGIIALTAIPSYRDMSVAFSRANAQAEFLFDIRKAHAKTITEGCRGIITIANDKQSYAYGCDYLPYDTNWPPSFDTQFFSRTLESSVLIDADDSLVISSRGQVIDSNDDPANRAITLMDSHTTDTFATGTLYLTGMMEFD